MEMPWVPLAVKRIDIAACDNPAAAATAPIAIFNSSAVYCHEKLSTGCSITSRYWDIDGARMAPYFFPAIATE